MRHLALLLLLLPAGAQEQKPVTPVDHAITNGVLWLRDAQREDGSWGPCRTDKTYDGPARGTVLFPAGPTLMALYTLSVCGVKKDHETMRKGYEWLRKRYRKTQVWTPGGTSTELGMYEAAALLLLLPQMHDGAVPRKPAKSGFKLPRRSKIPKDDWKWMNEAVYFLTDGRFDERRKAYVGCQTHLGGWSYGQATAKTVPDMASTHFALLGLRAAARAGYPVPTKVWYGATSYLEKMHSLQGGFGYRKAGEGTVGMTAAGIASWLICKEQLALAKKNVPRAIDDLLPEKWMQLDRAFDPASNTGHHPLRQYHFYALWVTEQAASMTGRNAIAGQDWHAAGTRFLLERQRKDGSWSDPSCIAPTDILGTCFALLFLKRSTPPLRKRR